MTHRPSVPPSSTAPYPVHPAAHAESIQTDEPSTVSNGGDKDAKLPDPAKILDAAAGIGSAAIVAALLYAR